MRKKNFLRRVSLGLMLSFLASQIYCIPNVKADSDNTYPYNVSPDSTYGYLMPQTYYSHAILADEYIDAPTHKQTPGANDADGWAFHQTVMFPANYSGIDEPSIDSMKRDYNGSVTGEQAMESVGYGISTTDDTDSHYYLNWKFGDMVNSTLEYNYSSLIYYREVDMYNDSVRVPYKVDPQSFQTTAAGATVWQSFPSYTSCRANTDFVHDYHLSTVTAHPQHTKPTADFYFNSGDSTESVNPGQTVQVIDGNTTDTYDDTDSLYWSTYTSMANNTHKHGDNHALPQSYAYDDAIIIKAAWSIYDSNGNNVTSQFHTQLGTRDKEGAATNFSFTPDASIAPGTYYVGHTVTDNWGPVLGGSVEQKKSFTVNAQPQSYTMTVHYIDTSNIYTDLVTPDPTSTTGQYSPTTSGLPSGYSLTGNYRTSPTGSDIPYYGSIDLSPLASNTDVYVMCTQSTPVPNSYTLNISYVDSSTNLPIYSGLAGCPSTKTYSDSDLKSIDDGTKYTYYLPQQAPTGYTQDTSKYKNYQLGYLVGFNMPASNVGANGTSTTNTANLIVYCSAAPPVTSTYNLTVHYVDEDSNNSIIPGYDEMHGYTQQQVISVNDNITLMMLDATAGYDYVPSAPSGYTLDTSKYNTSDGYLVAWGVDSQYTSLDGKSTTDDAVLNVYCSENTPIPPVSTTGTVIKKYFINGVEQTADENVISNVTPGVHTYNVDKSYAGYVCTNSPVNVTVYAGQTAYCYFYFSQPAATTGTVIERYYLDGVEKTSDEYTISNVTPGTHIYNVDKSYPGYNCIVSTETVAVTAGQTSYVDFYYSDAPTTGTVVKRYYLAGVEQTADEETILDVSPGSHTYNCDKIYTGYTVSQSSVTTTVYAGQTSYCNFYFNKNSAPPTCSIDAPATVHSGNNFTVIALASDPQGETLSYTWTSTDSQVVTGNQGTLTMGTKPITLTLYVIDAEGLKSPVATKTIQPANNPPTVTINVPSTVTLGDTLNVSANGIDSDGDPITYSWNLPDGATGMVTGNSGSVRFMNKADVGKQKSFTVNVADPYGGTGTAIASTTVVAPKPTVNITQSGTLKENRKVTLSETSDGGSKSFPIDSSKIQWSFYDINNNPINVTNTADSGLVESLDSTTGASGMDVLFTKAGSYTVKCTVTNTDGDTATVLKTITILPDVAPIADFDAPQIVYRDPNNSNRFTINVNDKSYSSDGDTISKRIWFYAFDSNNDGSFDDETFYVYSDGSWNKYGSYADVKALANDPTKIDSINSGNLTSISFTPENIYKNGEWESHVGTYRTEELIQEGFGQDTIQSLITSKDFKIGTTY